MLSNIQILKDGPRCNDSILQMFDAETFQVLGLEMLQQLIICCGLGEHPVIHLVHAIASTEVRFKDSTFSTLVQHFFRIKVTQEFVDIVERAFRRQELSCRNIQESNATSTLAEMYGCQEVILLVWKNRVTDCHTRCPQLGDTAFHQFLRQFRVFQLVTDGHALAGANQFGQVSVECMMGKPSHFNRLGLSVGTFCQGNAKNLGSYDRIIRISLIEVATTKQQDGLRMFCLEVKELFHHRSQNYIFCHYLPFCFNEDKDTQFKPKIGFWKWKRIGKSANIGEGHKKSGWKAALSNSANAVLKLKLMLVFYNQFLT